MVKVIDFVLYIFYHSLKNTNSVHQSIEAFSFVLDLRQSGEGDDTMCRADPLPPPRLPLSSWTVKSGDMKEGDILRKMGTPSSTPPSPGALPLHRPLFLTFSLRCRENSALSILCSTHPQASEPQHTLHVPPDHLPLPLRLPPPTPNTKHFTTGLACLPWFGVCIPTHCFAPWICYSVNSFPQLFQPCVFSPGLGYKMH